MEAKLRLGWSTVTTAYARVLSPGRNGGHVGTSPLSENPPNCSTEFGCSVAVRLSNEMPSQARKMLIVADATLLLALYTAILMRAGKSPSVRPVRICCWPGGFSVRNTGSLVLP